ncbi:MAG TPA: hypothetical protein DCS07_10720 [Bdellovibrionales bacterium]|nr:MAG: hypothetical protein A2Z97_02105 [Bdellovibrionales bacterium GWB1_52_6]OFZ02649.1 MAG: hypothetical protein A2X97_08360 [Bdellovibrionales bacterium GWA1_52_35]OFZ43785.1 MAG: hypothetical protein A2070_10155 [Bdellovibrionales bacterium GWC1_52_8]HAR43082.1 hypothetical protein [Bdellovibrionales bacterium]HCM41515.1 hypothetical protein [Bdellovibrionales bacterium]
MQSFLSLLLFGILNTTATPIAWNCQPAEWLSTPELKNGIFTAALTSECTVGAPGGRVLNLDQYLLDRVGQGTTIHEGPISETYADLPSIRYDLSMRLENDGNPVTIRSDVHFATDRKDRFVYASASKDIEATGTASYLKKVTERVEVTAQPESQFRFSVSSSIEVEQPWYAPSGAFKSQTTKSFVSNFQSARDQRVPHWGEKL